MGSGMADWQDFLSDADRATIERGNWARRGGFGVRPALIVIDAQNYMVGEEGRPDDPKYPLSCGDAGWAALAHIKRLLAAARAAHVPVFYTRFAIDPIVDDAGGFHRKLAPPKGDYIYLEGTHGSQIIEAIAPQPGELVITKKKSSAFFGTPLHAYLIDKSIDTLIVTGGATCNCVRATVNDSASYNFRTIVPEEAVFDRIEASHRITLFDINRFLGDVLPTDEVVAYLNGFAGRGTRAAE
jgi:nicotinamidase-related amidase